MNKDIKKIVKALESQGFTVETTRRGHLMVFLDGRLVVTLSSSPNDRRAVKNAIAKARRAGFKWPP